MTFLVKSLRVLRDSSGPKNAGDTARPAKDPRWGPVNNIFVRKLDFWAFFGCWMRFNFFSNIIMVQWQMAFVVLFFF